MNKFYSEEIKELELEYEESLSNYYKARKQIYFTRLTTIIGIIFYLGSAIFDINIYKLFGTVGVYLIHVVIGMCAFFAIISLLPSYKEDEKFKWHILERQRKKLDKLRNKSF
tara:strand:- start:376 stop:711 length:336 start_codon:yes stop_codon:yes gene_type:complete